MSSNESHRTVHTQIWRVLSLLDELPAKPHSGYQLDDLARAFLVLVSDDPEQHRGAETTIWSIWCDHEDEAARADMRRGVTVLSAGDLEQAANLFDDLTARYPHWAEAWNKRATVRYLQGFDAASVEDIYETLAREPRHFGALGGFAQICVRNGAPDAARQALIYLATINPGAPGINEAIASLNNAPSQVLH